MVKTYVICLLASLDHLTFGKKFQSWFSTLSNARLLLYEAEVVIGITCPCSHRLTLNHLVMLCKFLNRRLVSSVGRAPVSRVRAPDRTNRVLKIGGLKITEEERAFVIKSANG